MVRRIGMSAVVVFMILSLGPPARAGGWWSVIDLDDRYLVVGRTVEITSTEFVSTDAPTDADADARHYAYLVAGYDFSRLEAAMTKADPGHWWKLRGARTILLGEVAFRQTVLDLAMASATVVVPDVASGDYALMFCTEGCAEPLGSLIPTRVTVVPDAFTADLGRRLDRHESRYERRIAELSRTTRDLAGLTADALARSSNAVDAVRELHGRLDAVEDGMGDASVPNAAAQPFSRTPWRAYAAWFVAGAAATALGAWLLVRGRRRRPSIDTEELERWLNEEAPVTPAASAPRA